MKKHMLQLGSLAIATLLFTCALSGQRIATPPAQAPNYFDIRAELQKKADDAEELRKKQNRWRKHKRLDEVPEQMALEQWDWFWRERTLATAQRPGELANVADFTLAHVAADNPNLRGPGAPAAASAGAICSTALGNWIPLGPSSYNAPVLGNIETLYIDPANSNNILAGASRGGLFKTTNGGTSWVNISDAGRLPCMGITAIQVHPSNSSTIFIGTSSGLPYRGDFNYGFGLFRTTNGGTNWTNIFSPEDMNNGVFQNSIISDVLLHPQNPDIMYVLIGDKVYRSTNVNAATPSWTLILSSSTSAGNTLDFTEIEIIPGSSGVSNSKIVLCTSQDGWASPPPTYSEVYVSTNGGSTFSNITSILNPGNTNAVKRYTAAVQTGNSNEIFIGTTEPYPGGNSIFYLMKYNFTSGTNTAIGSIISYSNVFATLYMQMRPNFYKFEMAFSAINTNRLYVGGENLFSLNLSGNTIASYQLITEYWPIDRNTGASLYNTHCDIRDLHIRTSGGSDRIYAGTDGGVCMATCSPTANLSYSTSNWVNLNGSGLAIGQFFDVSGSESNYNLILGGAQDNGTFEYSGGTWKLREFSDGYQGIINQSNNNFFGNSNFGTFKGATGASTPFPYINQFMVRNYNAPIAQTPDLPNYFVTSQVDEFNSNNPPVTKLYYSNNFGTNIYPLNNFPQDGLTGVSAICIAPSDPNVIYVAKRGTRGNVSDPGKLYKSINGGINWTDISSPATLSAIIYAGITSIAVDPFNANRVFIGMGSYWPVNNSDPVQRYIGANRVLKSENGGTSWADITNGSLPACPINTLAYRTGTNDEIYAGNDFGVYRYNSTTLQWECFNNQLPVILVSALEIQNCKNVIRASTLGRGIWESSLPDPGAYNVMSNMTVSGNLYIGTDVVVKPGVTLTVTGTLYMSRNKRVIVERGATLNVNGGGKITNACGDLWYGIEVWGTSSASQTTPGAQGKVIVNGGTIENAHNGITTIKDANASWNWAYTGGIFEITNAQFLNNRRDIQVLGYHSPDSPEPDNVSFIKSSLFETNRQINESYQPTTRISIDNVKNLRIEGNTIRNTATTIYSANNRGTGIGTFNASFIVNDLFPNFTPSSPISNSIISGLTVGVQADFASGINYGASVLNTSFSNVQRSVTFNYSKGSIVSGNTISAVPNALNSNSSSSTWGIRMNNSASYMVEWNGVTGTSSSTLNNYGVIIDNGLQYNSLVGSNSFGNLYVGIQAQGNNGTASTGVRVSCNSFSSGITYQFVVCPQVAGSIANQGSSCSSPVKNTFGPASVSFGHVYSPLVMFVYYAASGSAPTSYSSNVSLLNCATAVTCPTQGDAEVMRTGSFTTEASTSNEAVTEEQKIEQAIYSMNYNEATQKIAIYPHPEGKAYYEVALHIARNGGNWFLLNEGELEILRQTAAAPVPQQLSAQQILHHVAGDIFERDVERIAENADLFANSGNDALLENYPNPFTSETTILCKVNENAVSAGLSITNTLGQEVKHITLTTGINRVTLGDSELAGGVYFYTLWVDDKIVATRKMVNAGK